MIYAISNHFASAPNLDTFYEWINQQKAAYEAHDAGKEGKGPMDDLLKSAVIALKEAASSTSYQFTQQEATEFIVNFVRDNMMEGMGSTAADIPSEPFELVRDVLMMEEAPDVDSFLELVYKLEETMSGGMNAEFMQAYIGRAIAK